MTRRFRMPGEPPLIGYHCSHEQHPPSALLTHVALAVDAGFIAGMCSDHYHPWSERQGHSGFAWSWLGAALGRSSMSFGTVCAPGQRYHPAVIAQAAATLAEMFPGRFWLAVGSGEALNEAITGAGWPDKATRHARLAESASILRALWAGETVSRRGHVVVDSARLYSRPGQPPPLLGAALTPQTARWVASWADGLITAAGTPDRLRAVVEAFREVADDDKPIFLQRTVSYAPTQAAAEAAALDQWRHCAVSAEQLANLTSPAAFDLTAAHVDRDDVLGVVRASPDIDRHIAWLHEDAALGFDRIYLHNVARDHERAFLDACGAHLLPAFAARGDRLTPKPIVDVPAPAEEEA
jgi:coenzyme F420-dependent glucose-6-phosphate dehydrogenase